MALEQADSYYVSPAFNGSSTAREQVGFLLDSAISGNDNGNLDGFIDGLFEDAVDECEYSE